MDMSGDLTEDVRVRMINACGEEGSAFRVTCKRRSGSRCES